MRVSRLRPEIDRAALSASYEVWAISTDGERIPRGAAVLDSDGLRGSVEAVSFHGGKQALALFRSGTRPREALLRAIGEAGDATLSVRRVPLEDVSDRDLLQLLLASLAKSRFERAGASNLGGRLLLVVPRHVRERGGRPFQVHALEVSVTPDLCLELRVRTFTSLAWRGALGGRKVPVEALPRHELAGGRFLRRSFQLSLDDPRAFVERALRGDRYGRFSFLDVSSAEAYSSCKVGVLDEVLQRLSERYGDAVRLRFAEVEDATRREGRTARAPKWREGVARAIGSQPVTLVDATGESGDLARAVAGRLEELFGIPVAVSSGLEGGQAAIRLVHDEASYGDGEDPYGEVPPGAVVQHLVVERAGRGGSIPDPVLEGALKELAVKLDVRRGAMRLADWPSLGIGGPWSFALRVDGPEGEGARAAYAFLDVGADGSLSFGTEEPDLLGLAPHAALTDALELDEEAEFALRSPSGEVNTVARTALYTVPDHAGIRRAFEESGAVSRGKEARAQHFADVTDVATAFEDARTGYYRVGVVGAGMGRTVTRASLLRQVRAADGSRLLLDELLPMLDVDFVRMRELAVTPFPIKYLREWLRMARPGAGAEEGGEGPGA